MEHHTQADAALTVATLMNLELGELATAIKKQKGRERFAEFFAKAKQDTGGGSISVRIGGFWLQM